MSSVRTDWVAECTLPQAQGPADMHDELFGHCLAALRFGVTHEACKAAISIAFQLDPSRAEVMGPCFGSHLWARDLYSYSGLQGISGF